MEHESRSVSKSLETPHHIFLNMIFKIISEVRLQGDKQTNISG